MTAHEPRGPSRNLWKVARVDTSKLNPEQRAEIIGWATSQGVDVNAIIPTLAITQDGDDGSYWLHLSAYVLDPLDDKKVIDHAADRVHSEPFVVEITEFPAWLPAVSHQQGDS